MVLLVRFRVQIDHNVCQGFGACIELCEEFSLSDEDGKSHIEGAKKITKNVLGEFIEVEELNCYMAAAKACPFKAISLINIETKERII